MGQRSRKKRRSAGAGASAPTSRPAPSGGGYYARQRARDEAARAELKPLAPGERPLAVTIAAVLAGVVGAANVALYLSGFELRGQEPQLVGVLLFSGLMAIASVFIWRKRYWAVLGMQALLAVTVLFAFLALLTAANVQAVVLCVVTMALAGTLFWFLVKAMARLQLPQRGTR